MLLFYDAEDASSGKAQYWSGSGVCDRRILLPVFINMGQNYKYTQREGNLAYIIF